MEVESIKFEQNAKEEVEGSDKEPIKKQGLCGVFRYRSMEREIINYNEHRDEKGEQEFLKSILVAFTF